MAYDTTADIIATAAVMCGLSSVANPYSSSDDAQIQLRTLLNQCGRELYALHQWQQFVKTHSFDTGASPVSTGLYDLPSDFGYFINQTGWDTTNQVPLGGPVTEQQYALLVSTDLATTTVYVSFSLANMKIRVLPAPAPANTTITFQYMSNGWVYEAGDTTTRTTKADEADDVVMFEPVLITTMLALRYKQAKGLPAKDLLEQFQAQLSLFTGVNAPAPVLNMAGCGGFPYINPWSNLPNTGYGS
jgi:hypothetical protein